MKRYHSLFLVFVCLFMNMDQLFSDVTLPAVLSDGMVLQRERPVQIWGWAEPGESVTVAIEDSRAKAKADKQGMWQIELPAMQSRRPVSYDHQWQQCNHIGECPGRRSLDLFRSIKYGMAHAQRDK
jgi:sialate O-acetylesterase